MEQSGYGATLSIKTDGQDYNKGETLDISDLFFTREVQAPEGMEHIDPALLQSFVSGSAKVHDRSRLPVEYEGAINGHEESHHFLADDFVRAVVTGKQPPIDAQRAALFTAPGIVALKSAKQGGKRLTIPQF